MARTDLSRTVPQGKARNSSIETRVEASSNDEDIEGMMRLDTVACQEPVQPWQGDAASGTDPRSTHVMRIIELAQTLAIAETAVLTGDDAKAVENLKRLQAYTRQMLALLEPQLAQPQPEELKEAS